MTGNAGHQPAAEGGPKVSSRAAQQSYFGHDTAQRLRPPQRVVRRLESERGDKTQSAGFGGLDTDELPNDLLGAHGPQTHG